MTPPIDTSAFQLSVDVDQDPVEGPLLEAFAVEARAYIQSRPAPPVKDLLLAYGVGGILGLFLVRFAAPLWGEMEGETELWVVVGDLPSIAFETENTPKPSIALRLYCAIAQDWADTILAERDLSECYPIRAAPTRDHAEMLLGRIEFIREKIIPLAAELDSGVSDSGSSSSSNS